MVKARGPRSWFLHFEIYKGANNIYGEVSIDTYFHWEASHSYGSKLRQEKYFFALASLQGTKTNFIY